MTPKERLKEIRAELERLEVERRAIYAASVRAPENEKVCANYIAEALGRPNPFPALTYPLEVSGIATDGNFVMHPLRGEKNRGKWVAVRPCAEEHKGETFLGLLLGDFATTVGIRYNPTDGVLCIYPSGHNPAIFVFSLNKIVYGYESWWGKLEKPEDLKQITDLDISNIWYVQAMKALEGKNADSE